MLHHRMLGCQFPNDTTYGSASYGHSCTDLSGFFLLLCFSPRVYMKISKSSNLNLWFCRLHQVFNSRAKVLIHKFFSYKNEMHLSTVYNAIPNCCFFLKLSAVYETGILILISHAISDSFYFVNYLKFYSICKR